MQSHIQGQASAKPAVVCSIRRAPGSILRGCIIQFAEPVIAERLEPTRQPQNLPASPPRKQQRYGGGDRSRPKAVTSLSAGAELPCELPTEQDRADTERASVVHLLHEQVREQGLWTCEQQGGEGCV